jgi:hypothetical protein
MKINLSDFNHLIFNYYPGAAGDLLLSALLDMDLNLNQVHRNILPNILYQIKGFEKTRNNRPYKWDDADKAWIYEQLIERNIIMPQSCHFVSFLDSHQITQINKIFKIYQIWVEPEHRLKVEFFNLIKNAPGNYNEVSELYKKIDLISTNVIDNYHDLTSKVVEQLNVISFQKLFYPPFDDFRMLYKKIRKKEPDLETYQKRTEKSLNLPKYIKLFDQDIEIDIENYKIKVI